MDSGAERRQPDDQWPYRILVLYLKVTQNTRLGKSSSFPSEIPPLIVPKGATRFNIGT